MWYTQLWSNIVEVNTVTDLADKAEKHDLVKHFLFGQLHFSHKSHPQSHFLDKLPFVAAAYDDYGCKKRSGPCFDGTRESLLDDIETWLATGGGSQIYVLSGLAGIGKSTVAFTIADRAKKAGSIGASFFLSRDGAE